MFKRMPTIHLVTTPYLDIPTIDSHRSLRDVVFAYKVDVERPDPNMLGEG